MKIRFFSNYAESSRLQSDFFLRSASKMSSRFSFTIHDDYDVAVIFNTTDVLLKRNAFKIVFVQEPSGNPYMKDYRFYEENNILFIHDPDLYAATSNAIEYPTVMHYADELPPDFFTRQTFVKKKKVSMIVSNYNFMPGHSDRLNLLANILSSDLDIDIYGRGHRIADRRYKGPLMFKHRGLIDYEYSICIENSYENNYVTEKFIDCLFCDTIPLYCGAPNISQIYHARGMDLINPQDSNCVEHIKNIIETDYRIKTGFCRSSLDIYQEFYNVQSVLTKVLT